MFLIDVNFSINISSLIAFLIGIIVGPILFVLIYILITTKTIKKDAIILDENSKNITKEEIEQDIKIAQDSFLRRTKEQKEITFKNIEIVSLQLIKQIASRFYPDSKNPICELTFEEIILLDHYIVEKLESLLDKRMLKPLRKLKLSQVLQILNIKSSIDNSKPVKVAKKYKFKKIGQIIWQAINIFNPVTWTKNVVINPAINILSKKICLQIIETIGQETYHVYSKQVFLDPVNDQELDQMLRLMSKENAIDNDDEFSYINDSSNED